MPGTRLVIARHGNTFAPGDVVTRVGARTDLPLVASGLAQAAALGTCLRSEGLVPSRIFTSRLRRTIMTAQKAQEAMGTNVAQEPLALFDEIDYGPDENRPEEEVKARLGAAREAWEDRAIVPDGWNVDPEKIAQGWIRFAKRLEEEEEGRTVLVVTSNGTARFAPHITGDPQGFLAKHKPRLATGAFSVFAHDGGIWSCERWNVRPPAV